MILETERLTLRRFRDGDLDVVVRWHADPRFTEHLGGGFDREETARRIERHQRHWDEHGFGLMAVEWKATGELIGRAGPQFHRLWPSDPEVGWSFDPAWWGRGLATEAGHASLDWLFGELGFARAVSITTEGNLASRQVMAKLGFSLLERLPDAHFGELWVHVLERPGP